MTDDRNHVPLWDGRNDAQQNAKNVALNLRDLGESVAKIAFYLFGSSLAMVISYSHNNSIPWGIGHGLLSWVYVLYFAIFK
jgi:hypothetical protein